MQKKMFQIMADSVSTRNFSPPLYNSQWLKKPDATFQIQYIVRVETDEYVSMLDC